MKHLLFGCICIMGLLTGCNQAIQVARITDTEPEIFPDYKHVTIPPNIAPLNFKLTEQEQKGNVYAVFEVESRKIAVKGRKGEFNIPASKWRTLLADADKGNEITVTICRKEGSEWVGYKPFTIRIANEPVDSHLAYRLIAPGYSLWAKMGIYQRNLENFDQSAIIENKMTGSNCMNCHSFRMQHPDEMLFHMRQTYPGTYLLRGDKIEKLNTKTGQTISALVYPSWHPSGRFVAFTVNNTKQAFHTNHPNRIEVFDMASDVLVYDVEKHEVFTVPELFSPDAFETFPTFSPDGKTLYFCSANAAPMPENYEKVKYSLCSIGFDVEKRSFGTVVDTVFNATQQDKSVSFPRVSPDGKCLLYTLSGYGNFSIWHKDADLYMMNLRTGEHYPLEAANSDDVESYHSWSSNSRWIVFSSRRMDGLYTRPYLAYIDDDGKAHKAFLLPQKSTEFYRKLMKSYNIPEFITGKVKYQSHTIVESAKHDPGINVNFFESSQYQKAVQIENMVN